jgi:hypothetical protein
VDGQRVPTRNPEALEAEVDGDRVVMSPENFAYFGLAGSGAEVWDLIDGVRSVSVIVDVLAGRHRAAAEVVAADVARFIEALGAAGLIDADLIDAGPIDAGPID